LEEYHYGWMQPNNDEGGSYTFRIEGDALPHEVWEECSRALNFFGRIRPHLTSYVVLDGYYGDLLKIPDFIKSKVGNNPAFLHLITGMSVELHALCDRAVNGFLAAGQSFRERILRKIGASPSSGHPVRELTKGLEASHAVYRLLIQLRNLGLHEEAVFRTIAVNVDADSQSYTVGLQLDKTELLSRLSPAKRKAVGDATDIPQKIDFLGAAREYMECHRTILRTALLTDVDDVAFSVGFMRAVLSGARGAPPNAIPLIFRGVPEEIRNGQFAEGATANANVIEVPREEFAYLVSIFPELSAE
jgi:hypothetical protein